MKILPSSFNDAGRTMTLIEREGDVALYSYCWEHKPGVLSGYEVVIIRKYADREIMGNFTPARESVPSQNQWGTEGWSFCSIHFDRAYEKYLKVACETGPSPIRGGEPTGKPRGRARSAFELDLSSFTGREFGFADVRDLFADVDEPMLRNRLKTEVDAKRVVFVRDEPKPEGQKGKARKVYKLA